MTLLREAWGGSDHPSHGSRRRRKTSERETTPVRERPPESPGPPVSRATSGDLSGSRGDGVCPSPSQMRKTTTGRPERDRSEADRNPSPGPSKRSADPFWRKRPTGEQTSGRGPKADAGAGLIPTDSGASPPSPSRPGPLSQMRTNPVSGDVRTEAPAPAAAEGKRTEKGRSRRSLFVCVPYPTPSPQLLLASAGSRTGGAAAGAGGAARAEGAAASRPEVGDGRPTAGGEAETGARGVGRRRGPRRGRAAAAGRARGAGVQRSAARECSRDGSGGGGYGKCWWRRRWRSRAGETTSAASAAGGGGGGGGGERDGGRPRRPVPVAGAAGGVGGEDAGDAPGGGLKPVAGAWAVLPSLPLRPSRCRPPPATWGGGGRVGRLPFSPRGEKESRERLTSGRAPHVALTLP